MVRLIREAAEEARMTELLDELNLGQRLEKMEKKVNKVSGLVRALGTKRIAN